MTTTQRFRNWRAMTPAEFMAAVLAEQAEIDAEQLHLDDCRRFIATGDLDQTTLAPTQTNRRN